MKMNKLLYGLFWCFAFLIVEKGLSQNTFIEKFDFYQSIVEMDGKEIGKDLIGFDCKVVFDYDKKIGRVTFKTLDNKNAFLNFQIIKKDEKETLLRTVPNISSKGLIYVVKDSISSKQKLEIISINNDEYIGKYRFLKKKK